MHEKHELQFHHDWQLKFYEIFSSLGLDRDIIADKESLFLKGAQINQYSMNDASDGEKSIAYLIMATLLAPQHSFIFIDEPERHLNGALMRNLFDKLETERLDLRFVYLTHNIDFVESRKNVALPPNLLDYVVNKEVFEFKNGWVDMPKGAGLGVDVNKELIIEENKTPHHWKNPVWRHADGSIAEW